MQAFIEDIKTSVELKFDWQAKWVDGLIGANNKSSSSSSSNTANDGIAEAQNKMETVEQMKSYLFQCQKLGYMVDVTICLKEADELMLFRIKSMTEDVVSVVQVRDGHELVAPDIKLSELISKYRIHKGKITELIPGWDATANPCSPLNSNTWKNELATARVHLAMAMVYEQHEEHVEHLELLQQPFGVKVTCDFAKGHLHIPAASMRIDNKASKHSIAVGLGLHISMQYKAPLDQDGKANKAPWVSAFWLVAKSDEELPSNMSVRYEDVDIQGERVHIPILINTCALKRGDSLRWNRDDVPQIGKQEKRKQPQSKQAGKKNAK